MRKRLLILLSSLMIGAGLCLASAALAAPVHVVAHGTVDRPKALAVPDGSVYNECSNIGKGWCMNAKGCKYSAGTPVINWYGGESCEYFRDEVVNYCNGNYLVTETCPFTVGSGLNAEFVNDLIVQVLYGTTPTNGVACIAAASSGAAVLNKCSSTSNGTGGATGNIFVLAPVSGGGTLLVNRYWSDLAYSYGEGTRNPLGACSLGGLGGAVGISQSPLNTSNCRWAAG
jgi:hypothetical protein